MFYSELSPQCFRNAVTMMVLYSSWNEYLERIDGAHLWCSGFNTLLEGPRNVLLAVLGNPLEFLVEIEFRLTLPVS